MSRRGIRFVAPLAPFLPRQKKPKFYIQEGEGCNMGIIGVLFEVVFRLAAAVFELIFGIIGVIIQYVWLPTLIVVGLCAIYFALRHTGGSSDHSDSSDVMIDVGNHRPPNFRAAFSDSLGMRNSCGTCTHCGDIRSTQPVCTKYDVKYRDIGCLDRTVCDDYNNILFNP